MFMQGDVYSMGNGFGHVDKAGGGVMVSYLNVEYVAVAVCVMMERHSLIATG